MANPKHVNILNEGVEKWNHWRMENDTILPDLSQINLSVKNFSLSGIDFQGVNLFNTGLSEANLTGAYLLDANLGNTNLHKAILSRAVLIGAKLVNTHLYEADLIGANLTGADLTGADMRGANLTGAKLTNADLTKTDLSNADLTGTDFDRTICVETIFNNATIENANIYGISVWNIQKEGFMQKNLSITSYDDPVITVDNIEVAQFIYLMLNNEKIREVIGTIAQKGVLILGRFTPERKKILDAIRNKLREYDFVPIMFDFEKADERDFTETIKILAGMSRFVIVDLTNPKSAPLELQATVPDYQIPFLPIIKKGEKPFSMFNDLQNKYDWVLPTMEYSSESALMKGFKKGIIDKALEIGRELFAKKQTPLKLDDIDNYQE